MLGIFMILSRSHFHPKKRRDSVKFSSLQLNKHPPFIILQCHQQHFWLSPPPSPAFARYPCPRPYQSYIFAVQVGNLLSTSTALKATIRTPPRHRRLLTRPSNTTASLNFPLHRRTDLDEIAQEKGKLELTNAGQDVCMRDYNLWEHNPFPHILI